MAKAEDFLGDESAYTEIDKKSGKGISVLAERARVWLVTLNNPQKYIDVNNSKAEVYKLLQPLCDAGRISYMAGIFEQSITVNENGQHTLHMHLVLYYPALARGGQLHKYLPYAALQPCCSSVPSVVEYICKNPSGKWYKNHPEKSAEKLPDEQAQFWEWGKMPQAPANKKNSLGADIIQLIKEGKSDTEIIDLFPNTWDKVRNMDALRTRLLMEKYGHCYRDMHCTYVEGPTNIGKTRDLNIAFNYSSYVISDYKNAWDKYIMQKTVILDEYRSQFSIQEILQFLDGNPCQLPARYDNKIACYDSVYIVSNWPLKMQYKNVFDRDLAAFRRRIHYLRHYISDGVYVDFYHDIATDTFIPLLPARVDISTISAILKGL